MPKNLDSYNYILPKKLIAHKPTEKRDRSRLMVVDKNSFSIENRYFFEVDNFLNKNDMLILNNSKVIPAKLIGRRDSGAKVEILLSERISDNGWKVFGRRLKIGTLLKFENSKLELKVIGKERQDTMVKFNLEGKNFWQEIKNIGKTPLPPYISTSGKEEEEFHQKRYQTVFAQKNGSIAAPTAGLHFTKKLLTKLHQKGVKIGYVTLHVGAGTFLPIKDNDLNRHVMHFEQYEVSKKIIKEIIETKKKGGKVVAVGTTSTRVLETIFSRDNICDIINDNTEETLAGRTNLFITEGYKFKIVSAMITNFHLPKTTLLVMVSAFAGHDLIKSAYHQAIKKGYRFYSYGDAMLIK